MFVMGESVDYFSVGGVIIASFPAGEVIIEYIPAGEVIIDCFRRAGSSLDIPAHAGSSSNIFPQARSSSNISLQARSRDLACDDVHRDLACNDIPRDAAYVSRIAEYRRRFIARYNFHPPFPKFKWQGSFHDHIIRDRKDFVHPLEYIRRQWLKHKLSENKYCFINQAICAEAL
jgi:hypothetical protein